MAKILLVVVVICAVYFVVRYYARGVSKRAQDTLTAAAAEDMVRCSHCGVHMPRSDCRIADDRYFCSEEHQRLHGR